MMRKKVLVTGGGGYLGSQLVKMLLREGHEVTAYDRFYFGTDVFNDIAADPEVAQRLTLVKKDIRDMEVSDLAGVDVVCDFAAFSNDPSGNLDPNLTINVNFLGRVHVAETAHAAGVPQYLLSSSCSVYGASESGGPCSEESPLNPLTVYAECNRKAEIGALALASDKFCVTALRMSTLFGMSAKMRFDLIINYMSYTAVAKRRLEVTGGGKQWRPILHVNDAARAFCTVMKADKAKINGQVFNIGHSNIQIMELASEVQQKLHFDVELVVIPSAVDKRNYMANFTKAKDVLGFESHITPMEGLREVTQALLERRLSYVPRTVTVDWYRHILDARKLVDDVTCNGRLL